MQHVYIQGCRSKELVPDSLCCYNRTACTSKCLKLMDMCSCLRGPVIVGLKENTFNALEIYGSYCVRPERLAQYRFIHLFIHSYVHSFHRYLQTYKHLSILFSTQASYKSNKTKQIPPNQGLYLDGLVQTFTPVSKTTK